MHPLQTVLTELCYETRAYSGLGMGGKDCLAVDLDGSSSNLWADLYASAPVGCESTKVVIARAIRGACEDSMGRDIVVYFPGVPFEVKS